MVACNLHNYAGLLLVCRWSAAGLLLVCCWSAAGMLLVSFCGCDGLLIPYTQSPDPLAVSLVAWTLVVVACSLVALTPGRRQLVEGDQ